MSRQFLVAVAIGATLLGVIVLMADAASDCAAKGGAWVRAFPAGYQCVAKL